VQHYSLFEKGVKIRRQTSRRDVTYQRGFLARLPIKTWTPIDWPCTDRHLAAPGKRIRANWK